MADTDIHAKLDRLLAGQAAQGQELADLGTALDATVQGVRGLVPLLSMQTEMLNLILQAATREPQGDTDLANLLANLVVSMERVETMLAVLSAEMRRAAAPPTLDGAGAERASN